MTRYKKLFTNSFLLMVGSIGSKFSSILLIPIYTRYLSVDAFGFADLSSTILNLLLPLVSLSIFDMLIREIVSNRKQAQRFQYMGIKILIGTNGLMWGLALFLMALHLIKLDYTIVFYTLLVLTLQSFETLFFSVLRAKNENVLFSAVSISEALLLLICTIVALKGFSLGLTGYFLAKITSQIAIVLFLLLKMGPFNQSYSFSKKEVKEFIQSSLPLIPNALMWWLINSSDKLLIVWFLGISYSGIFAAANKIPTLLVLLSTVFFQAWQVSVVEERQSETKGAFFDQIFTMYNLFMTLVTCLLLLFSTNLAHSLFSSKFYDAITYIPILLLATYFSNLSSFLGTNCVAEGETKFVFSTSIVGAGINLIMSPFLIYGLGLNGAGISTVCGFLYMTIVRFKKVKQLSGMTIKRKNFLMNLLFTCLVVFSYQFFYSKMVPIVAIVILVSYHHTYFLKAWAVGMKGITKYKSRIDDE